MAVLIPEVPQLVPGAAVHSGELETLAILKTGLPDTYRVFHGVQWTQGFTSTTKYGEIDFVVVDSAGEVLVIEQKNGPLEETEAGLVKKYFNKTKNVQDQLHRSIAAIRDKFGKQNHGVGMSVDYLIYCPEHRLVDVNSAAIDRQRVVDANKKAELCAQIQMLLPDNPPRHANTRERVLNFFQQTYEVVPDVGTYMDRQHRVFARLAGGLVQFVMALSFEPFRLRVQGGAGSGKSQVARQCYLRALDKGQRPIYVCFNRPLRRRMRETLSEEGGVFTFHGLCDKFLKEQGAALDYSKMKDDPNFWNDIFDQITASDIPESWKYDCLIVDEGQDFEPLWYELLGLFLNDNASIVWLEDQAQNLYQKPVVELPGFVTLEIDDNYRTPSSIARFIQEVHETSFRCMNPLPGLGVRVEGYDDPKDQLKMLRKRIAVLTKAGFKQENIVVLTCGAYHRSPIYEVDNLSGITLRKFSGEYDANGDQVYSDGKMLFDSVYRFKGGQSSAVILVDVSPADSHLEQARRVIECGMTRATVRLEMLVDAGNPNAAVYLDANEKVDD